MKKRKPMSAEAKLRISKAMKERYKRMKNGAAKDQTLDGGETVLPLRIAKEKIIIINVPVEISISQLEDSLIKKLTR